jgi:type VII secretion integral membrane protein EccD
LASTANAELSRVTIVAPATRVDLALPANVPLASLLPTLLRYAGEDLPDEPAAQAGWVLTRLGGRVLDSGRTPAQLDVRDGEVLYFTPKENAPEELIFDDVVDAVATATQRRTGRWQPDATRRFSVTFATLALLGGAAGMFFSGASALTVGIVGMLAALALVVAATVLARAFGDGRASVLLGLTALAYASVGGLLLFAGDRSWHQLAAPHMLTGATALVAFAAIATVATGEATGLFVGASGAGLALVVGAAICLIFGVPAAAAGAVIAAVVFGLIPALPMFAYRLARLPIPSVPTGPADLKADAETVDGLQILARSDRAEEILTGLTGTVALVLLGAEVALAFSGGLPGLLLCTVLALLLMLRARPLSGRRQRLTVLIAGTGGLALATAAYLAAAAPVVRVAVIPGVLVLVAVIALVYGLAVTGRRISPVWGRLLDIAEILLIVAVVPLAAWVSGLYGWIRAIRP